MAAWPEVLKQAKAGTITPGAARKALRGHEGERLLSTGDLARGLDLNPLVVQRDVRKGKLPSAQRIGRAYAFTVLAALDYYLEKQIGGGRPRE